MIKRRFIPKTEGVFEWLPFEDYANAPGLNKSVLNLLRECPAKFKQYRDGKIAPRQTKAMLYGSLLHAAILEQLFDYHVQPETKSDGKPWNYNATECKEWRALRFDLPIVTQEEDEEIRMVARHVRNHPLAWPLLKGSRRELSVFAEYGGHFMKGRPDAFNPETGVLCDVKKVADASTRALSNAIYAFGHHIQMALYHKLLAICGYNVTTTYFIAIELGATKGDPPLLNVRQLDPAAMEVGLRELESMLIKLDCCTKANFWPDYSGGAIELIDLPRFVYSEQDLTGVEEP